MTASWLMGVFVFAILIGDIRDIVSNARVNVLTYQRQLDGLVDYMNKNKVPRRVQVNLIFFTHNIFEKCKFSKSLILYAVGWCSDLNYDPPFS